MWICERKIHCNGQFKLTVKYTFSLSLSHSFLGRLWWFHCFSRRCCSLFGHVFFKALCLKRPMKNKAIFHVHRKVGFAVVVPAWWACKLSAKCMLWFWMGKAMNRPGSTHIRPVIVTRIQSNTNMWVIHTITWRILWFWLFVAVVGHSLFVLFVYRFLLVFG